MRMFAHNTGCNHILQRECEHVVGQLLETWRKHYHILSEIEMMELMCQTALYNTERKNVFNSSSPLTNLTVNDMHRNPNLVLLLINHSEALQISQEDAHLCQEQDAKNDSQGHSSPGALRDSQTTEGFAGSKQLQFLESYYLPSPHPQLDIPLPVLGMQICGSGL